MPPETTISKLPHSFVKPSEKLRPSTIPASKRPATIKTTHVMRVAPFYTLKATRLCFT
jgi:hypothetical protein